jgi:predicted nucleic acid-binding protein
MRYLDTNIMLRYLTRDDERKARACFALFQRVKQGEETLITSETIIAEVIFVLSSPSHYALSHEEISRRLLPMLTLRGLKFPKKKACLRAVELYAQYPALDFEDVLSVAHMEQGKLQEIYSYDTDFDRFSQIVRKEPEPAAEQAA